MKNLEHYLKIHLSTVTGYPKIDGIIPIGQEDFNVAWRAAVENVLDNIIDKLNKKELIMKPIIYKKITIDDNWMLVTQALIDKQAEIVDFINAVQIIESRLNLFKGE